MENTIVDIALNARLCILIDYDDSVWQRGYNMVEVGNYPDFGRELLPGNSYWLQVGNICC
ncbi:hypothetical protein D3C77_650480 [compost metagenome]